MRACLRLLIAAGSALCVVASGHAAHADRGTVVELDGMRARTPADWVEQPTGPGPRYKHFVLPRSKGDKRDTELIVFYFGAGRGGDVDANIARWKTIFEPPTGKSIDDVTRVKRFRVGAARITAVEIYGTYLYRKRPVDPILKAQRRKRHRMISVIIESENGPYFVRVVGPSKTVKRHRAAVFDWLEQLRAR